MWVPRTVGKGSGSWPTPTASDTEGGIAKDVEEKDGTFSRRNAKGERWGVKLRDAVAHTEKMWPTPNAVVVECTPEHHLERREKFKRGESKFNPGLKLETAVHMGPNPGTGALNPTWVEWLMGWPLGWTDLKPLEMDRFQQWLQQHGGS